MRIEEVKVRTPDLLERLLEVWENSVRATHLFLSDDEISSIKEYVPQALKEVAHLKTGSHTLQYIDVGTVKIRFIEDLNGNGRWDTGSLVERRQPERVGMYVDDNNSEEITTKENWELVFDVDMNRIFGPVTMESMTAKINRDNEARLKAIAKKRAEDAANQKKQHNSGGGMGMGSMGGMGGMIGR